MLQTGDFLFLFFAYKREDHRGRYLLLLLKKQLLLVLFNKNLFLRQWQISRSNREIVLLCLSITAEVVAARCMSFVGQGCLFSHLLPATQYDILLAWICN